MRIAKKQTGEKYIETPIGIWDLFFKAWMCDKTQPAPMPQKHRMFDDPKHYKVTVYDEPKEIQVNRATTVLVANGVILGMGTCTYCAGSGEIDYGHKFCPVCNPDAKLPEEVS